MHKLVWLIPLLPLLAATAIGIGYITGLNRGEAGERQTRRIAVGAGLLSLLLVLLIDGYALLEGAPEQLGFGTWLHSGEYTIRLSFTLDALGLSMTTLVALLSVLTLRFSVNYMHREAGYQRFFMTLSLFMAAMLLIVMAGNALLAFVGWELAGVSSYLLINYAFDRTKYNIEMRFADELNGWVDNAEFPAPDLGEHTYWYQQIIGYDGWQDPDQLMRRCFISLLGRVNLEHASISALFGWDWEL